MRSRILGLLTAFTAGSAATALLTGMVLLPASASGRGTATSGGAGLSQQEDARLEQLRARIDALAAKLATCPAPAAAAALPPHAQ